MQPIDDIDYCDSAVKCALLQTQLALRDLSASVSAYREAEGKYNAFYQANKDVLEAKWLEHHALDCQEHRLFGAKEGMYNAFVDQCKEVEE